MVILFTYGLSLASVKQQPQPSQTSCVVRRLPACPSHALLSVGRGLGPARQPTQAAPVVI